MDAISQAIEAVKTNLPSVAYRLDEQLRNHTSFQIGGPVRAMFLPENTRELTGLCRLMRECKVSPLILGNGTNILADDASLDIIVIKTMRLRAVERTGTTGISAEAGVSLSELASYACRCGLSGLEFAHGIPGTLGGAVLMNAGAYGGELKDVVLSTKAFTAENGEFTVTGEEHKFTYRRCLLTDTGGILLSSELLLREGEPEKITERINELAARRRKSQPLDLSSAGSVFKRPGTGYAAALIEQAGLKGYTAGRARVSVKHSGFIVNLGGATFSDVMSVIDHVRETVFRRFRIELELEVKVIRDPGSAGGN